MSEHISPMLSHKKGENTRSFVVYSVWNNKTDELVIIDGEARDCAKAMNLKLGSFYRAITSARNGTIKKWTIKERYLDGTKRKTKWI